MSAAAAWRYFPFVALLTVAGNEQRVAEFFRDSARLGLAPTHVRVYAFARNAFGTGSVDSEGSVIRPWSMGSSTAVILSVSRS